MNIEDIDKSELEDQWTRPQDEGGVRTLNYCEYPCGKIFGYWVEFQPDGCEIWADGDQSLYEFKYEVISEKDIGVQLPDTPVEIVMDDIRRGDLALAVEEDFDNYLGMYCYYLFSLSMDKRLVYKVPCYYDNDGYVAYLEEDYMCETYTAIEGKVYGFV